MKKEQRQHYCMIYLNDDLTKSLNDASKKLGISKNQVLKSYLLTNGRFKKYLNQINK